MDPQSSRQALSSNNFDVFNAQIQELALKTTKCAVSLPSSADMAFQRTMNPDYAKDLDLFSSKVLSMTNQLLGLLSTVDRTGKGKQKLESQDDVIDNFASIVVDSVDQLFERTDTCLDEYLGRNKTPAIAINPPKPKASKVVNTSTRLDPALQHASHLSKPQLLFTVKPDNANGTVWQPLLKHKFNAQVPLGYVFREGGVEMDSEEISLHPYHHETTHLSYPTHLLNPPLSSSPPSFPSSYTSTPFVLVTTSSQFSDMLNHLRKAKDIAIDLEHHSYRSFGGFVCLVQISTRERDWVVDLLVPELRDMMIELNEVFTHPNIVKVLHGADSDIIWLQQDFDVYIVNLFDTYHASKVLNFPRHGLKSLLEMYCDFTADKRYQLADWRIRPLPQEMLDYARSDTHFLLYIYDSLRSALVDRASSSQPHSRQPSPSENNSGEALSPLQEVLARSAQTSLRVYRKEIYDEEGGSGPGGWESLAKKWNKGCMLLAPGVQRNVFLGVHHWRDRLSREEDESTRYVLPNHHLLRLAEHPPNDIASLLAVLQPVPPVLRRRAGELLNVIRAAASEVDAVQPEILPEEGNDRIVVDDEVTSTSQPISTRLWIATPQQKSLSTPSSTLLGSKGPHASTGTATTYSTPRSSLFGARPAVQTVNSDASGFKALMSKIHRTLVIAPGAPKLTETIVANTVAETTPPNDQPEQAEMAYVAPSQRQTLKTTVDDSIVVVGQPKQKKRKRAKAAGVVESDDQSAEIPSPKKKGKGSAEGIGGVQVAADAETPPLEPFDFSSVPNILDECSVADPEEERAKKKQKKQKKPKAGGGVLEYGDFPAPPRAYRETRSGNQSQTFR